MRNTVPDILFYDFDFKLLHTENEFLSSNWTVYYNDIGTFEAHFDLRSDTLPVVMDNDYLVVTQGNLSAIIVGKKLGDELVIYGRTCNWLLTKRVTDAFPASTHTVDVLVNAKIKEAFSDSPLIAEDTIYNLPTITTNRDDKCETFSFVQESLQLANLGHKLKFDPVYSRWIFRILKGNENNPLVISTVNRNAYDITMESDSLKLCTEGWYKQQYQNMGEWDPQANALLDSEGNTISGTGISNNIEENFGKCWKVQFMQDSSYTSCVKFGMRLYPGDFVVCDNKDGILKKSAKADSFWAKVSGNSTNNGMLRWESILSSKRDEDALLELYNMKISNAIQGKTVGVHFGSEEEYQLNKCDYTLGDVVYVEWQSGNYKKRARKRITGVSLWYEPGNIGEEPIFEDVKE